MNSQNNDELQEEYDFSQMADGIQGKYAQQYHKDATLVLLEPDVSKVFTTAKSVNDALRALSKIIQQHEHVA